MIGFAAVIQNAMVCQCSATMGMAAWAALKNRFAGILIYLCVFVVMIFDMANNKSIDIWKIVLPPITMLMCCNWLIFTLCGKRTASNHTVSDERGVGVRIFVVVVMISVCIEFDGYFGLRDVSCNKGPAGNAMC